MPPLVRKWWSTYATLYQLTSEPTKGLTYIENNIHYLNLTPKKESIFQIKESTTEIEESPINIKESTTEIEESTTEIEDTVQEEDSPLAFVTPEIAFLKERVKTMTDEEYNQVILPQELYVEYKAYCNSNYYGNTMKPNEFKQTVKEVSHFHYECKKYKNKSKTNILQPNRQEAFEDYLSRGIITEADRVVVVEEEEDIEEEQENLLATQALPTLIDLLKENPPEPIILDSKEETLPAVLLTNCKASKYDSLFNF